jgi:hypothetical protein
MVPATLLFLVNAFCHSISRNSPVAEIRCYDAKGQAPFLPSLVLLFRLTPICRTIGRVQS